MSSNAINGLDSLRFAENETQGWKMFIDGKWVNSISGKRFVTFNPSTGQPLAEVPEANDEDIASAVIAAQKAFSTWKRLHVDERTKILKVFAEEIRNWSEHFGMIDALDSGNPYTAMVADAKKGAGLLDFFSGLGMEIKGETIPTPGGGLDYTLRQPFGVVARILPFNHPISFAAGKIAAPLVAGNTVILKPAEQTPLSALLLGRIAEKILPPGVLNIVTGDGPTCGSALVKHPKVYRIAFTGGVETGRKIISQAGIKTVSLELGGKNPLIIYPEADIEKAAEAAVAGMNFSRSQGQSCGSNSRVFIHDSIKEAFLEKVVEKVSKIKCGMAEKPETEMGPVISREHYDRIFSYIQAGHDEGARLLIGGKHPEDIELANGYFIEPTVFTEVEHGMKIEQDEIFGPVMSILSWNDEERMLHEVNDVEYGLCANIWTNNVSRALRMAEEIEAGYIWINGHGGKRFKGAPFGGYKNSGIGREHSLDELLSYTQIKNVNISY